MVSERARSPLVHQSCSQVVSALVQHAGPGHPSVPHHSLCGPSIESCARSTSARERCPRATLRLVTEEPWPDCIEGLCFLPCTQEGSGHIPMLAHTLLHRHTACTGLRLDGGHQQRVHSCVRSHVLAALHALALNAALVPILGGPELNITSMP